MKHLTNSKLETIKENYPGNKIRMNRFINDFNNGARMSYRQMIKWKLSRNPQKREKKNEKYNLNIQRIINLPMQQGDFMIWLGHASFYLKLAGKAILIDPCLISPPFYKRYSRLPCRISELGEIDYLLVSHGHFDHLDSGSIRKLRGEEITALLPLKMGRLIRSYNKKISTHEAGWYQKYKIDEQFEIYFLPAHHWYNRNMIDTNKLLWGSYLIKYKGVHIYFAGDSAYSEHFKEIAKLFSKIDICLMPIGAYKPHYTQRSIHMSPREAVLAFHDLNGKVFIPMHYGTFNLADEPFGEPIRLIKEINERGNLNGILKIPDIGEVVNISEL